MPRRFFAFPDGSSRKGRQDRKEDRQTATKASVFLFGQFANHSIESFLEVYLAEILISRPKRRWHSRNCAINHRVLRSPLRPLRPLREILSPDPYTTRQKNPYSPVLNLVPRRGSISVEIEPESLS